MSLNLGCCHLKYDCYKIYVTLMVTKKQKPVIDTQKLMESKHTTKPHRKRAREKEKKRKISKYPESNKMTISTCLSIMYLNVNGINTSKRIRWLNGSNKRHIYMLTTRGSLQM